MKCIFQIIGSKDSGKTTLIERMINEAKKRGLTVSVIKHSHHEIDLKYKDTWRFKSAGADLILFLSPTETIIITNNVNISIINLLPTDLILIEGFSDLDLGYKFNIKDIKELDKLFEEFLIILNNCNKKDNILIKVNDKIVKPEGFMYVIYNWMKLNSINEIKLLDNYL
jgi:molybdopterin-guanine dinucleotide biosynthesis protein B